MQQHWKQKQKQDQEFIEIPIDKNQESLDKQIDDETINEKDELKDIKHALEKQNKKKRQGGFQSLSLSYPLYKAITHLGYALPTPIQRKAIPHLLNGLDVCCMARTGSGKTAAFLIPMIQLLQTHKTSVGARALILSPSRELAQQTLKNARDLAKYTDLRCSLFVGGDSMDEQFQQLASNPDIIIATPGRLLHLIVESALSLNQIQYLVFDEADRLFEMGFQEQLTEILAQVPDTRQTLLFSATLPKLLIEFARAGLQNPLLIRLDVEQKISPDLKNYFLSCKQESKEACLLLLLQKIIDPSNSTIVFVATKHHVEYIHNLLIQNNISSTYIYGSLDQSARKSNLAKFRYGKAKILVVTDVAARGLDIPLLDSVINYDFPSSSKTFVHRVGRTARAGRQGSAYSLVTNHEVGYMLDLQLFMGAPLMPARLYKGSADYSKEMWFGRFKDSDIALEIESVSALRKGNILLETLKDSCGQGYKMYLRSRPAASKPSFTKAKELLATDVGIHPIFASNSQTEIDQQRMVNSIAQYRPAESIFEHKKAQKTPQALLMQKRRSELASKIELKRQARAEYTLKEEQSHTLDSTPLLPQDLEGFTVQPSRRKNYMSYRPSDDATEQGLSIGQDSFFARASQSQMDIVPEDEVGVRAKRRWDSKKHKFVSAQIGSDNKKRVRTENGTLVDASFKSDRFERWQKRTKLEIPKNGMQELSGQTSVDIGKKYRHKSVTPANPNSTAFKRKLARKEKELRKAGAKSKELSSKLDEWKREKAGKPNNVRGKSELKSAREVARQRAEKEKRREKTGRHHVGKNRARGKR